VLFVEDEARLARAGAAVLERLGYEVAVFVRPQDAIDALRADPSRFDVVMTDLNMPGISGLDVAREAARLRPGLPVVLMSGNSTVSDERLAEAGVSFRLEKPYTTDSLGRAVQCALAER
jgi:DNA-binding NtrC family response regulator